MFRIGQRVKIVGNTCSAPDRLTGRRAIITRLPGGNVVVIADGDPSAWWYAMNDVRPASEYSNEEQIDT